MSADIPTASHQEKSSDELFDDLARDLAAAIEAQAQKPDPDPDPGQTPDQAPDQAPDWAAKLSPNHAKLITDSAISADVAKERGYYTETKKAALQRLGFGSSQCRVPALVVPIYGVTGDIVTYQIRPDSPRVVDGKALKYETPRKSKMRLDVPPGARKSTGNPKIPLFITEGPRKADSAVSFGLCCVALLGVWNFRGANDDGGMTALADWESIALKGRKVYIVFDSDVVEKEAVQKALARLKTFLESRGATVKIIYLPSGDGGAKVGLDDYFAQGKGVDDLLSLATDKLRVTAEPEKPVEKTISKILSDGRVIEQMAGGVFAICDPKTGKITYAAKVETDEAIYKPLDDDFILRGGLFLPDKLIDYGDDATLDAEIEACINRYSDVPEREHRLSGRYVRLSYLTERLNEIAYLHATGPRGSGKSRYICTVGMLCMRPVLVTSPSAASLYRMMDAYHPTLIIDECNLATNNEDTLFLIQVLNAGFQRVTYIPRCEKGNDGQQTVRMFSPFGPKLIGGLKVSDSEAFESRCIQIRLEKTGRKDIPFRMTNQMLADFAELRAKLYAWRLKNLGRDWEKEFDSAERELKGRKIEPRFIQIAIPTYGLITDQQLKKDFAAMMEVRTDDAANEKKESIDGQIAALIHAQLFDVVEVEENGETVTKATLKAGASAPSLEDGKPCEDLRVELLVEKINEKVPEKYKTSPRYLGKQIRDLGLKTREIQSRASSHYKKSAIIFDRIALGKVFANFSLAVPPDFSSGQSGQSCNLNIPDGLTCPDENLQAASSKISSGQVNTQENQQLAEAPGLTGSNFPEFSSEDSGWVIFGDDEATSTGDGYHVSQDLWPDESRFLDAIAE